MTYSERLHIPWWWLVIAALFVVSIAVAVLAYVPLEVGISISVLTLVGVALALGLYSRTLLRVDGSGFSAGRYHVEPGYIAGAVALRGEDARLAIGPEVDHRAFLFTRPFVGDLVRVDLDDAADPHPYWLISSRHPDKLASAIEAVKAA